MFESKYPHLFEPIILNRTYFKNRIFASPQGTSNHEGDHRRDSSGTGCRDGSC